MAGFASWDAKLFGQEKGDMVGGLNMAFDTLAGGLLGLVGSLVLGVLLTKKKT